MGMLPSCSTSHAISKTVVALWFPQFLVMRVHFDPPKLQGSPLWVKNGIDLTAAVHALPPHHQGLAQFLPGPGVTEAVPGLLPLHKNTHRLLAASPLPQREIFCKQ